MRGEGNISKAHLHCNDNHNVRALLIEVSTLLVMCRWHACV